jgi:predicted amidohydrolase
MKLAMIAMRPKLTDKKANLKKMESYIKKTKADMYVFGELSLIGYHTKDEFRDLAETENGESIKFMKKLAEKHKAYIVFGMPIIDKNVKGLIYNSSVMIHPNGKIDIYKKWFLPTFGPFEEKIFIDEGENFCLCETKFGKIGLIVCYDIFFPELCKAYSLLGADMIICISATPSVNRKYFETLMPARAIENTVFFAYINLVGTQENLVLWGGSQVYSPFGELIKKSPYFKESIITCNLDFKQIKLARANRPVIRDVRPELFYDLFNISRLHKKKNKK